MSSAQQRLAAVSSSLSHPKGLLAGDVAIITGVRTSTILLCSACSLRPVEAGADSLSLPPTSSRSRQQAAQGIGRSCALLFAKEGAKVVVSDLDQAKAQKVVDEIKQLGGQAIAVGGDVTADGFAKKLIEETVAYVNSFVSAVCTYPAESARSASRTEQFRRGGCLARHSRKIADPSPLPSSSAFGSVEHIVNNVSTAPW